MAVVELSDDGGASNNRRTTSNTASARKNIDSELQPPKQNVRQKSLSKGEREYLLLTDKFLKQVEGNTTYHICKYCMKLAEHYMQGKYVESDAVKAEELCDSAIKYASILYSERTRKKKKRNLG